MSKIEKSEEVVTPGVIDKLVGDDVDMFVTEIELGLLDRGLDDCSTLRSVLMKLFSGKNVEGLERSILDSILKNKDVIQNLEGTLGIEKFQAFLKYIEIIFIKNQVKSIMDEDSIYGVDRVDGKDYLAEITGDNSSTVGRIMITLDDYYVVSDLLDDKHHLVHKDFGTVTFKLPSLYTKSAEDSGFTFLWNEEEVTIFKNPENMCTFSHDIKGLKNVKVLDNNDDYSVTLQVGDNVLYKMFIDNKGNIQKELILESDDSIENILKVYHSGSAPIIKCATNSGRKYFVGGENGMCLNPHNDVDKVIYNENYFALRTRNFNGTKNLDIYRNGSFENIIELKNIDFVGKSNYGEIFTSYGDKEGIIYIISYSGEVEKIHIGEVDKIKMFTQKYENPNDQNSIQRFFEITKGSSISMVTVDLGSDEIDFESDGLGLENSTITYVVDNISTGDNISNYGFRFFEDNENNLYLYAGKLKREDSRYLQESIFEFEIYIQSKETGKFASISTDEANMIPGEFIVGKKGIDIIPKDFSSQAGISPVDKGWFVEKLQDKPQFYDYGSFTKKGKLSWLPKMLGIKI